MLSACYALALNVLYTIQCQHNSRIQTIPTICSSVAIKMRILCYTFSYVAIFMWSVVDHIVVDCLFAIILLLYTIQWFSHVLLMGEKLLLNTYSLWHTTQFHRHLLYLTCMMYNIIFVQEGWLVSVTWQTGVCVCVCVCVCLSCRLPRVSGWTAGYSCGSTYLTLNTNPWVSML